jgi:hypothetical protein
MFKEQKKIILLFTFTKGYSFFFFFFKLSFVCCKCGVLNEHVLR